MGRMHAPGTGIFQSVLPCRRTVPSCLKLNAEDVKEQIQKLGTKGLTPSKFCIILRDSLSVAQVRFVNGNKILRRFIAHDQEDRCYSPVSTGWPVITRLKVSILLPNWK